MQISKFTIVAAMLHLAASAPAEALNLHNEEKSIIYYTTMEMGGMTMAMDMKTIVPDDFTSTLNEGRTYADATTSSSVASSTSSSSDASSTSSSMSMNMDNMSSMESSSSETTSQESSSSTAASEENTSSSVLQIQSGSSNKMQLNALLAGLSAIGLALI